MEQIERDREIITLLNFEPAEIALLCARVQGFPMGGQCYISAENERIHDDAKGNHWRVDTKELANKLTSASFEQRCALNRAILRFWEQYPSAEPIDAMRAAGFI